jgi:hypothetical protein
MIVDDKDPKNEPRKKDVDEMVDYYMNAGGSVYYRINDDYERDSKAVKDIDENDVTYNYHINEDIGVLTILPVKLTIKTDRSEKVYDGLILENNKFEITEGQLLASHVLNIEFMYSMIDVCEVYNDIVISIINQENKDVTHNYDITKDLGVLTILQDH